MTPYGRGFMDKCAELLTEGDRKAFLERLSDIAVPGSAAYGLDKGLGPASSKWIDFVMRGQEEFTDEQIEKLRQIAERVQRAQVRAGRRPKKLPLSKYELDRLTLYSYPPSSGISSRFDPTENWAETGVDKGTVVHELGHAMDAAVPTRLGLALRGLGHFGPRIGTAGAVLADDPETRWRIAGAGSLAALPMIMQELKASHIGSRMLKKRGVKGMARLSPYMGVPTYVAGATLPLAAAGLKGAYLRAKDHFLSDEEEEV